MIYGPKSVTCPNCGRCGVQFLVGLGAFCIGCGNLRHRIVPGKGWETLAVPENEISDVWFPVKNLTNAAVDDAMSGRTSLPAPHDPQLST
jgi:hypothetical protein